MNKTNHPMDEMFRDKLKDHEIAPADHIWEGVNKAVNKRNRRLWPLLATIIILVSAAIFYFIWSTSNGTQAANNAGISEVEHTQQQSDQDQSKETENTREIVNSDLEQLNESHTTSSEIDRRKENRANATGKTNPNSPETSSETTAGTPISNTSEEELAVNASDRKANTDNNSSVATPQKDENEQATAIITGKEATDYSKTSSEKTNPVAEIQIADNSRAVWDTPIQDLDVTNEGLHRFEISHFKSVEKQQKNILLNTDLCAILYPKSKECPGFEDLSRRFQFDVYGLVGKKFSNLSTNNNVPGVNDYLNKRRTTETPLWNIGLGIRLSNQWTNGLSVRGGLEISRGQIRLNYNDESKKTVVTNVAVDTIVDSLGNTTVVWDTISVEETNIIPVEVYNKFTLLDIPVTVGYTFLGSKYDIEINTGVVFNVLFEKSGSILDADGEARPINAAQSGSINAYNNEVGISIIASAGINYHLTDQLSVFAEPQLRYFIKPVSPELYPIRESWFHLNVLLGGRYSF